MSTIEIFFYTGVTILLLATWTTPRPLTAAEQRVAVFNRLVATGCILIGVAGVLGFVYLMNKVGGVL